MQEKTKRPAPEGSRRSRSAAPPKKKKKVNRKLLFLKRVITVLVSMFLSIFLICIITGTIVATAVAVYVLDFMDESSTITLEEMELSYNTNVYAYDKEGNLLTLYQVNNEIQRIPVTIEEIPQHTQDAFVYTEDERFYTHDGVDYKNTIAACLNMVLNFWDSERGGSTITQQLIKNVTGDDERSPSRKIREIFRAMTLEKNYSKQEIMETYLNYIGFGGAANGIEMASIKYFGKNVGDLTVAESACLAAIPQSPETINPFAYYIDDETGEKVVYGRERNRERQEYVLWQMYEHGAITFDEYQAALNEHLIFTDTDEYAALHPEDDAEDYLTESGATTWVVDAALREVQAYLMETYNIDEEEALHRINTGGYQIYTTVDMEMQAYVEEKYLDLNNLVDASRVAKYEDTNLDGVVDEEDDIIYPQCAFIAMDYSGNILSVVGATGEKKDSLIWNYATMEPRQPGSTIKPITTYAMGIYSDQFHWGSKILDYGLTLPDGTIWPKNYSSDSISSNYSNSEKFLYYGLQKSLNTISARLCDALTTETVFTFATENMGLDLLRIDAGGFTDVALSPLSVGALSYGVTMQNMINAYVPYGNGGTYYESHIVSRLEQGNHELVFENNGNPHEAVDPETAYVMNRLMKNVVSPSGTAGAAMLSNKEVVGKTGTTQDWDDLWFIGLTEDFVSGIWIGYTERDSLPSSVKSAQIWYNAIGEYANSLDTGAAYPVCETVIEEYMCTNTGLIAGEDCPKSEQKGYWKSTNAPKCEGCVEASSENESAEGNTDEEGATENPPTEGGEPPVVDPTEAPAPEPQPTDPPAPQPTDPPAPDPTPAPAEPGNEA